jgi:23S rRNA (adenine2503-C2)-methyltransferase
MENIMNYTKEELEKKLVELGEKKFKATQIFEWIYKHQVYDFSNMGNISKDTKEVLKSNFEFKWIKIVKVEEDKLTKKFLFELEDKEHIEAVLMEHDYGLSVCVSSQVGCNMHCAFCESGRFGKKRNLKAYEIVEQIILIEEYIAKKIDSIVIMGIGEPFDNYDEFVRFIYIVNDNKGLNIGSRHITVSTCGIIPKIKEFAKLPFQVNLAISLHASNNELRNELMPVNKVYSLKDLIETIKEYIAKTSRRVTIEYVMLNMVNDNRENAIELAKLLKGMNVYINLIPYNETDSNFKKSSKERINEFYDTLKKNGINVTIRKEFGGNISAACGQLRSKVENKVEGSD